MANKGCILLARAIEDSAIWDKPPYFLKAWIHILNKACWRDTGTLKRGQCFITIKELKRKLEKYEGETGQLYGARYYIPYEDKYNEMIKTYVNRIESFCNKSMFKRIMCAIKKNI